MRQIQRQLLLRWCLHCNASTEQVRLTGGDRWRCEMCGREQISGDAGKLDAARDSELRTQD
jgi:ubiquitin C-terminal hydrolase